MLVLLFLMIFNIVFAVDVLAFRIEGNVDYDLEKTIRQYYEHNGVKNLDRFLKNIGIDNYTLTDDKLILGEEHKIRKISIKGNIIFLDSTIKRISGLREGIAFKDIDINKIKRNIEKYYKDNGYAKGHVKSIDFKDGEVIVQISEGKLFIVDGVLVESEDIGDKKIPFLKFTDDKSFRLPTIAGIDIMPKIYNRQTIEYYQNKLNKLLNEHGYFDSSIEYYTEKSKINHPFINRKVPFSSLLSVLPFFHKSVKLVFRIKYGPQYELIINGVQDDLKDKIQEIIYNNVRKVDTFNIREVEYKVSRLMLNNLYMQPDVTTEVIDNKIVINVTYEKAYDKIDYNIKFKKHSNNTFVDTFIKNYKLSTTANEFAEKLKDYIIYNLQSEGYYTPEIKIEVKDRNNILLLTGTVDEGSIYKIGDILVNEEVFKKNINQIANEKNIKNIQKSVENELSMKYVLFNMSLLEKKIINNKKINLLFEANIKKVDLRDIYIYKKLVYKRMIERVFKKDRNITSNKISKVRETLKKQPQISAYNIRPVNNDNETVDLVVHTEEATKNQVYGSLGYDNVDKLRFTLGYRRKNFLSTLHTLEVMGGITTKEKEFGVSLVGFDVVGQKMNDIVSYVFRDRDEDEYDYMMNRFNLGLNKFGDKYFLGTTMYYENIDIRDTDFTPEIEHKFLNKYDNFGLNIDFKYFMVDNKLSPTNGAIFNIKLTPVNFFKEEDFYKSEVALTLYKSAFDKILLVANGEFGAIGGKNKNIPLPYRFTLGGPNKMKAFDYRDIGSEDDNGNVYGGKYYYYGIVYAGYKLAPLVYIGPFFEAGAAFDDFNDIETYNDAGAMLDLKTNVGSFIMSYAFNTKNSKKSKRAFYITFQTTF